MGPALAVLPFLAGAGEVAGGAAALGSAAGTFGAISTGLSVGGSILGGIAGNRAANYQAAVANNNAQIMKLNEDSSLEAGQNAESQQRLKTGALIKEQKAVQGASGVDVAVGTPFDVRAGAAAQGELDAQTIRYNAARQAYGYGVEAQNYKDEAKADKATAKQALIGGILGGASSFFGGASSMAGNAAKLKLAGAS